MSALRIRRATVDDLETLAAIEGQCFGRHDPHDQLAAELSRSWAVIFVTEWHEAAAVEVTGFINVWRVADEVEVLFVATAPRFQRRGHARIAMQETLRWAAGDGARSAVLEVRPSNVAARALYASLGFVEVGRRDRYYDDGEDALLLRATLDAPAREL